MKPFTSEQQYLISQGEILTERLMSKVQAALGFAQTPIEVKRHHYIYSPPGAGKTFAVQSAADSAGIEMLKIHGSSSMNALIVALATMVYSQQDAENLIVWIDDCDSLFMDNEYLNVLKGAFDEDRNTLSWNKNLSQQINLYLNSSNVNDQLKGMALQSFQPTGSVGIEIPTNKIRFIVTSNKPLTAPNSKLNTPRKMNEAAIRDRVVYTAFDLDSKLSWGWVAHMLLSNDILNLASEHKQILLDWMYTNWERLPATSMRAVKELAADMINHPKDYPDRWQAILA